MEKQTPELAKNLAVFSHEKGVRLAKRGDVDRGLSEMYYAEQTYNRAGTLPRALHARKKSLPIPSNTEEALLSGLCPDDRQRLLSSDGKDVLDNLRHGCLGLIRPFETECDDCYRVMWDGISMARAGNMYNAFDAYWLATYAGRYGVKVPSRGRYILDINTVEKMIGGDQRERMRRCMRALKSAKKRHDPVLILQATIWKGGVHAALGEFSEGRVELSSVLFAPTDWVKALRTRIQGMIEYLGRNFDDARPVLNDAARLYRSLDPHLEGLMLIEHGGLFIETGEYETSTDLYQKAKQVIDHRRDPSLCDFIVPLHTAISLALAGQLNEAETTLTQCQGCDTEGKYTPFFQNSLACVRLLQGRADESRSLFSESMIGFDKSGRRLEVALTATYLIEAHASAGDRGGAIQSAELAFNLFESMDCTIETIQTLQRIRALLDTDSDRHNIIRWVRALGKNNGGWLPSESQPSK